MYCAYKNFLLFNENDISSLYISLSAVQFAITEGSCFALEFTGISSGNVKCSVKSDTLFICNNLKLPGLSYFDHTRNTSLIPRILLTVPCGKVFDFVHIDSFASSLRACTSYIKCTDAKIECRCGSTELNLCVFRRAELNCFAGSMKIHLIAETESLLPASVDSKAFAGVVTENGKDKNCFGSDFAAQKGNTHVSALCAVGRIDIDTDESNTGANAKPAVR